MLAIRAGTVASSPGCWFSANASMERPATAPPQHNLPRMDSAFSFASRVWDGGGLSLFFCANCSAIELKFPSSAVIRSVSVTPIWLVSRIVFRFNMLSRLNWLCSTSL